MRLVKIALTFGVFIVLASLHVSNASARELFVPKGDLVIFAVGQDSDSIRRYVKEFNKVPAGVMGYTSIQLLNGVFEPDDRGGGTQFLDKLAQKYPNATIQIGLYMVGVLPDIINGKYDGNISRLSEWIISTKRPVYLRIGYEFDFPQNHYEPELYKKAFRHIVDYMEKYGVKNVNFVWHSYASSGSRKALDWYPGDEYVDWIGISFFEAYNVSDQEYIARLAREKGKPLMIAESTPYSISVKKGEISWGRWFSRYFDFINKHNVKMFCYICVNWDVLPMYKGGGWGDSRVYEDKYVKKEWVEKLSSDKYLAASDKLFELLGFNNNQQGLLKNE